MCASVPCAKECSTFLVVDGRVIVMKKYLILLFLTLCFSNVNANSKEIELSNPKLLNYSCIGTYSTCFCKRSGGVFTKYIGDKIDTKNICGDGKELISYGKYLEFGGEPKHLSNGHQGGTDSSEAYNTYENFFLEFEPTTLKIFSKENNSTFLFCLFSDGDIVEFSGNSQSCGTSGKKLSFKEFQYLTKAGNKFPGNTKYWKEILKINKAFYNGTITRQQYEKKLEQLILMHENNVEISKTDNTSKKSEQAIQKTEVVQTTLDKKSLKEELSYWKELFQDELITQAEYDAKRKELLSGASVTTSTTVAEPKVEKKKVAAQKQETKNENTKTIDISFKSKNYISQSLQGSLGFFANDGKIKDYCEDKYPKLHVYMECYAQNLKKSKVYKKARNLYDIYIELGRHLAWEAVLGNVSDSSARYQLAAKRQEMNDAYTENNSKKWKNIANALDEIKERHYPTPPPPEKSNKQTCDIQYFNGKAESMICK